MQSKLNPYLSFRDNAREAMNFYKSIFGGKLEMSTFKEFNMSKDPSEDNRIMHSMLEAPNGITFMGSDTPKSMEHHRVSNITMALNGDNEGELSGYFDKLAAGGKVNQRLENAPWGDRFGSLTDRYGINWMINIAGKKP